MMGYDFNTKLFRATCVHVVDGDTVDLVVDQGFRQYFRGRFRLLDIDTYEMNDKDPTKRGLALEAKQFVIDALKPVDVVDFSSWPLEVYVEKDSDNFGRWLADINYFDSSGVEHNLNEGLFERGLVLKYVSLCQFF